MALARPGVGLPGTVRMREAEQLAAEAEDAGASSVWVADVRREPFLTSAAALRATRRVTVGIDVAVAFSRSPAVTAQAAWDLAGYGDGRFVLGLGSQVGPTLLSRFGVEADRPAARLRDYVLAVRACWDAYRNGRGRYEGDFYAIRQPVFSPGADDPGLREEADAILAAIADRRRTEAARIVEERCLDQLGVAVLDDLPERLRLWSAYADVIGLTVPWYGLDRDAQLALFRDVLRALARM